MVELDEAMRRALLAREDPPSQARDAILASLRTRLGGPSDPGEPGSSDPGDVPLAGDPIGSGGQVIWGAKIAAATIGLTTAGLLTLKVGALAFAGVGDQHPRAATIEIAEASTASAPIEPTTEPSSPPLEEPTIEPTSEPESPSSAHAPADAPTDEDSSLAAELALVRAAKQARTDDPEGALAQLELHRQRFANGMLAPEREALRIELLCELDRTSEADAARERFLVDFAGSPLRARVVASCSKLGTDPRAAGD